ncbi:hypothetical protein BDN67DRAFT_1064438 [Paxillus ammoniavirescens]|nr:hypothetical protein BDN67DRAFT_1064438 [Paxillus ammoniavirescens]
MPEHIHTTLWLFLRQWDDTLSFHANLFHCFLFRLLARLRGMDLVSKGSNGTSALLLAPIFGLMGLSDGSGVSRGLGLRPSSPWIHFYSNDAGMQCPPKKRPRDFSWLLSTEGSPANNHTSPNFPSHPAHTHSPLVETRHFLVSSEMPGPEEGPGNYSVPLLAVASIVIVWLFILVFIVWNCSDSAKQAQSDATGIELGPTADLDEWLIRPLLDDDDNFMEGKVIDDMINGGAEDLKGQRSIMPGAWLEELQGQGAIIGAARELVVHTVERCSCGLSVAYPTSTSVDSTGHVAKNSRCVAAPIRYVSKDHQPNNDDRTFWTNLDASKVQTIAFNPLHKFTPYDTKREAQKHTPLTVLSENDPELLGTGTPCRLSTRPSEKYGPVVKDRNGAEGTVELELDYDIMKPDSGHADKFTSTSTPEISSHNDLDPPPPTQPQRDESSSGRQMDDGPDCGDVSDSDSQGMEVALPKKGYEHNVLGRRTASLDVTVTPLRRARSTGYLLKKRELLDDNEVVGGDSFWADQVDARLSGRQDIYQAPRRSEHRYSSCDPFWYQGGREDDVDNWRQRHPQDTYIGKENPIPDKAGQVEYLGTQIEEGSTKERRYSMPPLKFDSADDEWPNLSSDRADRSADAPQGRYVVPQKRAQMRDPHLSPQSRPRLSPNGSSNLSFFPFKRTPSLLVADAWRAGCLCVPNPPVDEFREVDEWWDSMTLLFQSVPGLEPSLEDVRVGRPEARPNDWERQEDIDDSGLEFEAPMDPETSEGRALDVAERRREHTANSQGIPFQLGRQDAISWRDRYENDPATRRFISGHQRSVTGGP